MGDVTTPHGPTSFLFAFLVALGAAIVAMAPNITVLYAGRFIFGAGSESLVVAQSAILARWFKGKELALSFGIALTISYFERISG